MGKLVSFLGLDFPHTALKKLFLDYTTLSVHINLWNHYYRDSETEFVYEGSSFLGNAPRVESFLDNAAEEATKKLDAFLDGIRKDLYRALEDEYEFLTSDEQKAEFLEGMGIEFEEDGTRVA